MKTSAAMVAPQSATLTITLTRAIRATASEYTRAHVAIHSDSRFAPGDRGWSRSAAMLTVGRYLVAPHPYGATGSSRNG